MGEFLKFVVDSNSAGFYLIHKELKGDRYLLNTGKVTDTTSYVDNTRDYYFTTKEMAKAALDKYNQMHNKRQFEIKSLSTSQYYIIDPSTRSSTMEGIEEEVYLTNNGKVIKYMEYVKSGGSEQKFYFRDESHAKQILDAYYKQFEPTKTQELQGLINQTRVKLDSMETQLANTALFIKSIKESIQTLEQKIL